MWATRMRVALDGAHASIRTAIKPSNSVNVDHNVAFTLAVKLAESALWVSSGPTIGTEGSIPSRALPQRGSPTIQTHHHRSYHVEVHHSLHASRRRCRHHSGCGYGRAGPDACRSHRQVRCGAFRSRSHCRQAEG